VVSTMHVYFLNGSPITLDENCHTVADVKVKASLKTEQFAPDFLVLSLDNLNNYDLPETHEIGSGRYQVIAIPNEDMDRLEYWQKTIEIHSPRDRESTLRAIERAKEEDHEQLLKDMLWQAAYENNTAILQCLADSGVCIDEPGRFRTTPLYITVRRGHRECTEALLNAKVDPHDIHGVTISPLAGASIDGNKEMIDLLLNTGRIDINARDNAGHTILHYVAMNGDLQLIPYLVSRGADIEMETEMGFDCFHLARRRKTGVCLDKILHKVSPL